jgi:hypothetical protein
MLLKEILLITLSFLIYCCILIAFLYRCKNTIQTALINLIILSIYSGLFLYSISRRTEGIDYQQYYITFIIALSIHSAFNIKGIKNTAQK